MPAKGQTRLYRPVPADFPETFIVVGWVGIEKHYHVHARTVSRWIDICGREGLVERRAAYVRRQREARKRNAHAQPEFAA